MEFTLFYSPVANGFFDSRLLEEYTRCNTLPDDVTEMTREEVVAYYMTTPPAGKQLGAINSRPAWVDVPPLTRKDLIAIAGQKKKRLINEANSFINTRQWPGKAAIGRLKDEELTQYHLWLDYLDALDSIDTAQDADIEWPLIPSA